MGHPSPSPDTHIPDTSGAGCWMLDAPTGWPCPAGAFSSFTKAYALWWGEEVLQERPPPLPTLWGHHGRGRHPPRNLFCFGCSRRAKLLGRDWGLNPSSATPWLCDLGQVAQPLCFLASTPQISLTQVLSDLASGCDP